MFHVEMRTLPISFAGNETVSGTVVLVGWAGTASFDPFDFFAGRDSTSECSDSSASFLLVDFARFGGIVDDFNERDWGRLIVAPNRTRTGGSRALVMATMNISPTWLSNTIGAEPNFNVYYLLPQRSRLSALTPYLSLYLLRWRR
jgi:hypothetical protein